MCAALRAPAGGEAAAATGAARQLTVTDAGADPLFGITHGLLTGRFTDSAAASVGDVPDATAAGGATQPATSGAPDGIRGTVEAPSGGGADSSSGSFAGQPEAVYFREIARLGAQVADALEYAHRQGVIHRDIKPPNLLLDTRGNVWVTDFGLAKVVEGDDLSQSHDLVGTLRFMAPERFRGVTSPLGDVYSLGAALYELLTLQPAFAQRDQARLVDQVTREPPAPLRQHDRRIPRDLETIVLKALAKDPKNRFRSAGELHDELRRYLESRPIRSRRVGPVERLWRWSRRNPGLAAASILAVMLATALLVGSSVAAWVYRDQRMTLEIEQGKTQANLTRALQAERTANDRLARTEKAEREGQLALGQSLLSEGAALQRTGLSGQRFESLDRLAQAARILAADPEGRKLLPEIRNHAIAALCLPDLRVRRQHDCGDVFDLGVDAAVERYALVDRSGAVIVCRLDGDRELMRLPGPDHRDFWWASPAFSPDGELLVARYALKGGRGALLRVWHLSRRELLASLPSRGYAVFHPTSRRALFAAPEGGIAIWDRDERRVVRSLPLDFRPSNYAIDPAGRRLAVNNADVASPRLVILEVETGRVLANWTSHVGIGATAWSADGQLLAVGNYGRDPRVYVWNVRDGALSSVLEGHPLEVLSAQFAHTGFLLATGSWDTTTRLWDAASGEPLMSAPGGLRGFAPDDRRLAFQNRREIGVWDVATASECRTLHPGMLGNRSERRDASAVRQADFSPDGRLVATCDFDGVRLWETDSGCELAHLKTGECETVLFHPDGQSLISASIWGVYRWPISLDPAHGPDAIRVGPPELLRETAGAVDNHAAWLPDHRTLAIIDNPNARVLLVDTSRPHPAWSRAITFDAGNSHRMKMVGVSPDGRWLAVGGWYEPGARVWDLHRRRLERILCPQDAVGDTKFFTGFSPDGRWLVSCTCPDAGRTSYHFWRVGTWALERRIDQKRSGMALQPPAFTGDGRMMAMGIAPDQVMLADVATGRELARLTTLQSVTPTPLAFSPDGTKLVGRTDQKTALLWDLRQIREQLASRGLDWEAPPYPIALAATEVSGPAPAPRPVQVVGEVVEPNAARATELTELDRRLAVAPDDAEALIRRGWRFTQQKKWPEAIADLERLFRLRPGDADACWLLAEAYQETGRQAGALRAFNRLLERAPDDHEARFQRGLVALALAQPGLAADDFGRVLAVSPDLDVARYSRARALIRLGRHREALADLDFLISKGPDNFALYDLRGIVRDALGDHEQAGADREKAGTLLPSNPDALNERAWVEATGPFIQRDPERAVLLARRAVALAHSSPLILNTLGVALYRAGRYTEAIEALNRSCAAGSSGIPPYDLLFLAMAHHQEGRHQEAHRLYDQAVRWLAAQKSLPELQAKELTAFRAEAEAVLAGSFDDLPADIFAPTTEMPTRLR